jgi:hypothetical protein
MSISRAVQDGLHDELARKDVGHPRGRHSERGELPPMHELPFLSGLRAQGMREACEKDRTGKVSP